MCLMGLSARQSVVGAQGFPVERTRGIANSSVSKTVYERGRNANVSPSVSECATAKLTSVIAVSQHTTSVQTVGI